MIYYRADAITAVLSSDIGGDSRRSGRLQAVPLGAVDFLQRRPIPRVDPHEDRQRRTGVLLGPKVRPHAGAHPESDAGRHCGQLAESRRDRTDSQTLQVFTFLLCRPDGPVPTRPEFGNISSTRYRFAAAAAALKSHHQRERLTVDGNVLFPGLLDWCQPINRISAPVFPAAAAARADVVTLTKMRRIINK